MRCGRAICAVFLFTGLLLSACSKQVITTTAVTGEIKSHPMEVEQDLDLLIKQIGNAKVVLLGEASHGTAEFYNIRAAITKKLMQEKGFKAMAVEGEWADSYRVNSFVRGPKRDSISAIQVLKNYDRWPTWMWANTEIASLVTWMNGFNQSKAEDRKAGFYGLDVYCLWESTQELKPYLRAADTAVINAANKVEQCFKPYSADPQQYAYAVAIPNAACNNQTANLWTKIVNITGDSTATDEAHFVMQQNALVALNGEQYYRTAASSFNDSWNIRDRHISATLNRLMRFLGPDAKLIVWEHNTHIGDARVH